MANTHKRILIVDDEEQIRSLLESCLDDEYDCQTAASAEEATTKLSTSCYNLVLTDINMAGATGLELCQLVQKLYPETVVIVVSAMTDIEYAITAMRHGALDYVTKPFSITHLRIAVKRALMYQEALAARRLHEEILEEAVMGKTEELVQANLTLNELVEKMYSNYRATLRGLALALEMRDYETRGHSDRVVANCLRLGRQMGLGQLELVGLEQGALLHDIGKIGVPDRVLLKPGSLNEQEWPLMREHINHGLRIVSGIEFLAPSRPIIGQHHEKVNGSGYPNGFKGEEIHLHARIFAVADAFDAITSDRPYRPAQSFEAARDEIVSNAGSHFDEQVVDAFLDVPPNEWLDIRSATEANSSGGDLDTDQMWLFLASIGSHPDQVISRLAARR
ncbi:MAG TPA: HD domain-containing phosphohydrolase [Blastocatellia bacterium]|nr:HD domain-containing phosphohydrolase [Blastocatellia bacterium]